VIEILALELVSEGRFVAPHGAMAVGPNVFGAQILAQLAFAAQRTMSDHPLTSMHAIFPRPASVEAPLYIDIDVIRHGRNATLLGHRAPGRGSLRDGTLRWIGTAGHRRRTVADGW